MVETEGTHAAGIDGSEMQKQVQAQTPLGRLGQPDDIASTAVFLASADSSWISGETFVVAGGLR
jgi:3-oxoacyl-[acyl-carrier protein] reductase